MLFQPTKTRVTLLGNLLPFEKNKIPTANREHLLNELKAMGFIEGITCRTYAGKCTVYSINNLRPQQSKE